MILILSNPQDVHARHISRKLQQRGLDVVCFSRGEIGMGDSVTLSPDTHRGALTLAGRPRITTDDISTVWHRRPGTVQVGAVLTDEYDRSFAQNEWAMALDGLLSLESMRHVSHPVKQRAATKPLQLSLASKVGLRVPRTLITSDPQEALAFVAEHHGAVVHKAMTAPPHQFIDTRAWDAKASQHVVDLALCPTILQERIVGPADVRATVIGGQIFAARILTSQGRADVDSRLDSDAPCTRHELPDDVGDALLRLMDELGLVFGTVDFKVAENGEHVFLEVNPQGQFLYIEILTGLPISDALTEFLAA